VTTVAVLDYGMGNLRSVSQALRAAAAGTGHQVLVTQRPEEVRAAERLVLPGQGAMPDCMRELRASGLLAAVLEAAASKPLFGVCVGMQMLLDHSAEGDTPGLGLIAGEVLKFALRGQTAARWQPLQGAANGLESGLSQRVGQRSPPGVGRYSGRQLFLFCPQFLCQTV